MLQPYRAVPSLLVAAVLFATPMLAQQETPQALGPDVTVFDLMDTINYGTSGGIRGYSLGTRSCNRGGTPLNWCDETSGCAPGATNHDHPVIAQNMYRLADGRFEQVGMSWLKHGFVSTNSTSAGCTGSSGQSCVQPPFGGNQLGIGCTDPYVASLNGSRPLGMRSEVNPTDGSYPFPYTHITPTLIYEQRIKVPESDLDPAQNPGALYWMEGQYIAPDDAVADKALNNASYRPVTVTAGTFNLAFSAATVEMHSAIDAWQVEDPSVERTDVDFKTGSGPTERFQVARRVTDLGGGVWHYEYAIRNHNSERAAQAFSVDFPDGNVLSNAGFKDIDSHSGEPYSTTDWTIDVNAPSSTLTWSTETFATNQNANALRWATMYNFWFDAGVPPALATQTLTLFTPGTPSQLTFFFSIFSDGFESGGTTNWSETSP